MPTLDIELVEELLRQNREIQSYAVARIHALQLSISELEEVLYTLTPSSVSVRSIGIKRKRMEQKEAFAEGTDKCFVFYGPRGLCAPPMQPRAPCYCLSFGPKFRWNPRAMDSLTRQVARLGLDREEKGTSSKWQTIADALNYESSAAVAVKAWECRRQYEALLSPPSAPFSRDEERFIDRHPAGRGARAWRQIASDLFRPFGRRRTPFQVAQRHRLSRRADFECADAPPASVGSGADARIDDSAILDVTFRANAGRRPPWWTEESVRRARRGDGGLLPAVCGLLLRGEVFDRAGRRALREALGFDPTDRSAHARATPTQLSIEAAAAALSASVADLTERVIAVVMRWHGSVYAANYFRVSMHLFGHRNAARACFLLAREYERQRKGSSATGHHLQLV